MHLFKCLHFSHGLCDHLCIDTRLCTCMLCLVWQAFTDSTSHAVSCLMKMPFCSFFGFGLAYVHVCAHTRMQRGYGQIPFFIKQVTFSCWCSIYLSSFWQSSVPFSQHLTKDQWEKAFWRCFQVLRQGRWSESCHKLQTHLTNEELFWRSVNCCHIS